MWLLHNLTLDGKLCLRDDKNAALNVTSTSLAMTGEPGKRRARRANQQDADSDWLNPFYLGTMSDSADFDNLA